MYCLEGRHFFRAQGYSRISLMVNTTLIVPLTKIAHATVKLSIYILKAFNKVQLSVFLDFFSKYIAYYIFTFGVKFWFRVPPNYVKYADRLFEDALCDTVALKSELFPTF